MNSWLPIAGAAGIAACVAGFWCLTVDSSKPIAAPVEASPAQMVVSGTPKASPTPQSFKASKLRKEISDEVITLEAEVAVLPAFATQALTLAESDIDAAFALVAKEAEPKLLGEWNVWIASAVGRKHPEWLAKLVSFTKSSREMQELISFVIAEQTYRDLTAVERVVRTELEGPAKEYGLYQLTQARARRGEITEAVKLHAEMPASSFRGTALRAVAQAIHSRPPQVIKNWIGGLDEADRIPAWQLILMALSERNDDRSIEELLPDVSDSWQRSQAIQAIVKSRLHRKGDSELQRFIEGLPEPEQAIAREQMERVAARAREQSRLGSPEWRKRIEEL